MIFMITNMLPKNLNPSASIVLLLIISSKLLTQVFCCTLRFLHLYEICAGCYHGNTKSYKTSVHFHYPLKIIQPSISLKQCKTVKDNLHLRVSHLYCWQEYVGWITLSRQGIGNMQHTQLLQPCKSVVAGHTEEEYRTNFRENVARARYDMPHEQLNGGCRDPAAPQ